MFIIAKRGAKDPEFYQEGGLSLGPDNYFGRSLKRSELIRGHGTGFKKAIYIWAITDSKAGPDYQAIFPMADIPFQAPEKIQEPVIVVKVRCAFLFGFIEIYCTSCQPIVIEYWEFQGKAAGKGAFK